jgi:putative SOS response-associated peptidase YedK
MPVIFHPDEYRTWLDRLVTNPARLVHLFQPYPADLMEMWQVSPLVNNVRNDSADLIEPVVGNTVNG